MRMYRAGELARLAGLTVRALHHYDAIGLLAPSGRSEAGYRLYGEGDLLRLQQILLYRGMGLPLEEIRRVLDDPEFDVIRALEMHLGVARAEIERLEQVAATIERTLERMSTEDEMLSNEDLYKGIAPAEAERRRREARERYGEEEVARSEERLRQLTRKEWNDVGDAGESINRGLAERMDLPVDAPEIQELVARHYAWTCHFWQPDSVSYRALGAGYAQDPEFRAFYERYRPGLGEYLARAIDYYATNVLEPRELEELGDL